MDFQYFWEYNHFFQPKTPLTALKGLKEGVLPKEAFIYRATSLKPLFEKPYDFEELDRVLARKHMDLPTKILLMRIFKELITHEDPEVTLFAAESINILEQRYIEAIEKAKEIKKKDKSLSLLGIYYYEMAILNRDVQTISHFYFEQSNLFFTELMKHRALKERESSIYCRINFLLQDYQRVQEFLRDATEPFRDSNSYFLLIAELHFHTGNFPKIPQIMEKLHGKLTEREKVLQETWRVYE